MPEFINEAIVRIRNRSREVVGSGFLVSPNLVLTCAHVIDRADNPSPPGPVSTSSRPPTTPRRASSTGDWASRAPEKQAAQCRELDSSA
jgi:V8-like Glu-specific endopeptidase